MFSFRNDKTGFFSTIALIVVVAGMLIATGVLLIVGISQGNWEYYSLPIRIVLGASWLACIVIVLVRIRVFGVQRKNKRLLAQYQANQGETQNPPQKENNG